MALPYFYEAGIEPNTGAFTLSEDTSKHCVQVLRMRSGEQLHLTNGRGDLFLATILSADKKHSEVKIESITTAPFPARRITIAMSLLKNTARFEWFLEKSTEIGVASVIPLICDRTEKQHFRHERMNNIVIAAMLQSQQSWLPVLTGPMKAEQVIGIGQGQKLIAHCDDRHKEELRSCTISDEVLMLIGPEGDFSAAEITVAMDNGFQAVSLGSNRLRTETAGVVAAALLKNL